MSRPSQGFLVEETSTADAIFILQNDFGLSRRQILHHVGMLHEAYDVPKDLAAKLAAHYSPLISVQLAMNLNSIDPSLADDPWAYAVVHAGQTTSESTGYLSEKDRLRTIAAIARDTDKTITTAMATHSLGWDDAYWLVQEYGESVFREGFSLGKALSERDQGYNPVEDSQNLPFATSDPDCVDVSCCCEPSGYEVIAKLREEFPRHVLHTLSDQELDVIANAIGPGTRGQDPVAGSDLEPRTIYPVSWLEMRGLDNILGFCRHGDMRVTGEYEDACDRIPEGFRPLTEHYGWQAEDDLYSEMAPGHDSRNT